MQKIKSKIQVISSFLLKTLELQLFLMGLSLPILIGWGLPVSIVSWFSTPLFAPLFFLFLLCCIGMFFLYFVPIIPAWPVAYVLEKITHWWLHLLSWYKPWWLIGFAKPHPVILIAFAGVIFMIMHYKKWMHQWQRIGAMTAAITIFCVALKLYAWAQLPILVSIPCHTKVLYVVSGSDYTVAIDTGALATKPINSSWIEYELIPELTKATGKIAFTHIICLQASVRTLEAVCMINAYCPLRTIVLPSYKGYCPQPYYVQFKKLKDELTLATRLIYVSAKAPYNFVLDNQSKLQVVCAKEIAYGTATFLLLSLTGNVREKKLTIDAQKLK